jgi:uncharacterized protein (TIGR00106 family)
MVMVEISVVPLGTGTPSVSKYADEGVRVLQGGKDIKYELTAMGTIIDDALTRPLALAGKMHQAVFDAGAIRVAATNKTDERRGKASSMDSKVAVVKKELGR